MTTADSDSTESATTVKPFNEETTTKSHVVPKPTKKGTVKVTPKLELSFDEPTEITKAPHPGKLLEKFKTNNLINFLHELI